MIRLIKWWLSLLCLMAGPAAAQTVEYIHTDALGSPVAVTDASRNVIERSEYEPYGQLLNRPLKDGPGYTGHVLDAATGLNYMQQRYYDPLIGRFLSVDPVTAYQSGDQKYFNRYWYAGGNPYRFIDPDGRRLVIVGDVKFKQEIKAQIKELKTTATGRAIVRALERSKETIHIKSTKGVSRADATDQKSARNGVGSGGTIQHNPAYRGPVNTTEGRNQPTPSHIVLGHELMHGVDYVRGTLDRSWNRETQMRRSEEKAMGVENQLRREFNVPQRTSYGP